MPFHVELRQGMSRAWAFNLAQEEVWRSVLDPWRRGVPVALGDKEWDPRESSVRILEGPELAPPELAMGRGWHSAERSAEDVTVALLEQIASQAASVAVVAESPAARRTVVDLLGEFGVPIVDWSDLRSRILARATVVGGAAAELGVGAVILVPDGVDPDQTWLFDAGLALGALGGRAILVQLGDQPPPPQLRDLGVVRLDPEQPASIQALAERLRQAVGRAGRATG